MPTTRIAVERICVESSKSFEDILLGLEKGIGRPDIEVLQPQLNAASSFWEFRDLLNSAVGSADLMEFLRLDLGGALRKRAGERRPLVLIATSQPLPLFLVEGTVQIGDQPAR